MNRRSVNFLRFCLVIFAMVSALCVSGPALYYKFRRRLGLRGRVSVYCSPCNCNCPSQSIFQIAPGLGNLSVTDCGKDDPDIKEEMEKQFVDLLSEELKLQETVAEEHAKHMNVTIGEARRLASQYQREAEKCNSATEICEGARERAETLISKERKVTVFVGKTCSRTWLGRRVADIYKMKPRTRYNHLFHILTTVLVIFQLTKFAGN